MFLELAKQIAGLKQPFNLNKHKLTHKHTCDSERTDWIKSLLALQYLASAEPYHYSLRQLLNKFSKSATNVSFSLRYNYTV